MIYVQGIVMPKVYYYLNSILFECKISINYLFLFTHIIVRIYKIKTYYLSYFELQIYRYKLFKLNAKGEKVYHYLNSILFECNISITYLFLFNQIIVRNYKIKIYYLSYFELRIYRYKLFKLNAEVRIS